MNALRNIFNTSTRTFNYLRQNGTNAFLNWNLQPVDGINANKATCADVFPKESVELQSKPTLIPKSILDSTNFKPKKFNSNGVSLQSEGSTSPTTLKRLRRLQKKVELIYLCKICNTRNTKEVSEAAYKSGVVILQCDGCSINHLICDNLGWFTNKNGHNEIEIDLDFDQVLASRMGERNVKVIKVNEHGELI